MAEIGVTVNLVLMALNLLPIPPLDGGRILVGVLPDAAGRAVSRIEPFGLFIIVGLLVLRVLDDLMLPLMRGAFAIIATMLSILGVPLTGTRS
jgi:Zn-dependent protease